VSQNNGKQNSDVRNTLGVGGQVYDQLLSKLETDQHDGTPDMRRVHTRLPFADPFVRVIVEGDNSSRREMMLACRNLSRGGLGLLHSTFMYPGTRVIAYLQRTDGGTPGLRGRVVRVQHRGGVVHEIGIKFDKDINPRDYLPGDFTEALPSFERVAPDKLNGSVVFVTESDAVRRAVKGFLLETNLNFKFAENTEQAIAAADDAPDMLVVDIDFAETTGPELVKRLRSKGYNKPVALIGEPGQGLTRSIVRVCGADALVRAPMTQDGLLRVLGEFMLCGWDPDYLDKARSKIDRATLVTLCFELSKLGVVMDQQVRLDDRVALFGTCQKVRSMALLVGMNGVASMADRLAEQAAEGNDPEIMEELVEQVRLGCAAAGKAAA
jgi:CheY-like chemotaxis protein